MFNVIINRYILSVIMLFWIQFCMYFSPFSFALFSCDLITKFINVFQFLFLFVCLSIVGFRSTITTMFWYSNLYNNIVLIADFLISNTFSKILHLCSLLLRYAVFYIIFLCRWFPTFTVYLCFLLSFPFYNFPVSTCDLFSST